MTDPVIQQLIRHHESWAETYRARQAQDATGTATPAWEAACGDSSACEFGRLLDAGCVHFQGRIAAGAVAALHETFHAVAARIVALRTARAPQDEVDAYQGVLLDLSRQLVTLMRGAWVRPAPGTTYRSTET